VQKLLKKDEGNKRGADVSESNKFKSACIAAGAETRGVYIKLF
jgi:hypothetical protein